MCIIINVNTFRSFFTVQNIALSKKLNLEMCSSLNTKETVSCLYLLYMHNMASFYLKHTIDYFEVTINFKLFLKYFVHR